ncbi:putative metallo-beta-lactamase domain protein [Thozetella sp. PMI_491]|nr:putative metallo-beta-lactamase domain protein [Thozetella sp. PMI_491]
MAQELQIHDIFEPNTGTWQYIVADPSTHVAAIIDSVLDYNPATSELTTKTADNLLSVVKDSGYTVDWILETHVHADHITAAKYLQTKLEQTQGTKPSIAIGERVRQVQEHFGNRYAIPSSEYADAFDKLFGDDEKFSIGNIEGEAIHLPGHTPDHLGYRIGANVFVGDSLFNHDVGSARCDFPGGSASALYQSVRKLLGLPEHFKLWTGHDYPPGGEGRIEPLSATTVKDQTESNKHLKKGVTEEEFTKWRKERDATLGEPRLLHQSLQLNVRAGQLPAETEAGDRLLHVPLKLKEFKL